MTTMFFILWGVLLGAAAVLVSTLDWAVHSPRFSQYRLRTPAASYTGPPRKRLNVGLNNVLALLIFIAFFYHFGADTLYPGWPGTAHFVGETLAVLLLYDCVYYFYHRAMHHPKVMKFVHGMHHKVRFPTAGESVYLNPLEQIGALLILLGATMLLGPVSEMSFLAIFFIYSSVNIIVHSNLVLPHPAFRLFNFWVQKHDTHHDTFRYNYASIFPFWDQAFGTFK